MLFRQRTVQEFFAQVDIVILKLLVQKRNLELPFATLLKQQESTCEKQEKDDETGEQLRAKGGLLHI